jgi:heme A synthase
MKNTREILMYVLAAIFVLGFFVLVGMLLSKGIPEQNQELLHLSIGTLLAIVTMIMQWFFGSSRGSSDKNELLKK